MPTLDDGSAPTSGGTQPRPLKVFVSYARRDGSELAEDLVAGLELAGFNAFQDRHDIAAAEDWEARLGKLIHDADTVVFALSPGALASKRVAWEVARAKELTKRLIPVIAVAVTEGDIPEDLRRLNFIDFTDRSKLMTRLQELAGALRNNLEWIREHTRLGEVASRWLERERPEDLLLRGAELAEALKWKAARSPDAPELTDGQSALIAASVDAETARANLERKRLADIETAQAGQARALAERADALADLTRAVTEREKALKRQKRMLSVFGVVAITVAGIIGGLGYWTVRTAAERDAQQQRAVEAEARSEEAAIERDAARTDITGQLIAYAASDGELASGGAAGQNSPYTTILLTELADRNVSLQSALARSNRKVLDDTGQRQRPYLASDVNGDIFFQRRPPSRHCRALSVSVDHAGEHSFQNVERDAVRWQEELTGWGFEVQRLVNPARQSVVDAVHAVRFEGTANPTRGSAPANTCLLFFFSGGGVQIDGAEFLLFSDTRIDNTASIRKTGSRVDELARLMREASAASFLVLDTAFPDWSD